MVLRMALLVVDCWGIFDDFWRNRGISTLDIRVLIWYNRGRLANSMEEC